MATLGPAEVDDHPAPLRHRRCAQPRITGDLVGARRKRAVGQREIEKTRPGDFETFQPLVIAQAAP
ncbi:MAG: hypothetical protein WDN06_09875 [Asticcacaulis sp.]